MSVGSNFLNPLLKDGGFFFLSDFYCEYLAKTR